MKCQMVWRVVALALVIVLALPVGVAFASEEGATLRVVGTTTADINGQSVAAAVQGDMVTLEGTNFRFDELVGVWITFPDGRVLGLDNENVRANKAGAFTTSLRLDGQFATGLHRISARGKVSGRGGIASMMLMGGGGLPATVGTQLRFIPESAPQNGSLEMYGSGFAAKENVSLWMTRPDGIVISLGYVQVCNEGLFGMDLALPASLPIGQYNLTARGNTSGNVTTAQFTVRSGADPNAPGPDFTANIGTVQQRSVVGLSGDGFRANESVSFWLTKPNGAVLGLGEVRADSSGVLDAAIYLSEALPVGTHYVSFRSNISEQIGFVEVYLAPGPITE